MASDGTLATAGFPTRGRTSGCRRAPTRRRGRRPAEKPDAASVPALAEALAELGSVAVPTELVSQAFGYAEEDEGAPAAPDESPMKVAESSELPNTVCPQAHCIQHSRPPCSHSAPPGRAHRSAISLDCAHIPGLHARFRRDARARWLCWSLLRTWTERSAFLARSNVGALFGRRPRRRAHGGAARCRSREGDHTEVRRALVEHGRRWAPEPVQESSGVTFSAMPRCASRRRRPSWRRTCPPAARRYVFEGSGSVSAGGQSTPVAEHAGGGRGGHGRRVDDDEPGDGRRVERVARGTRVAARPLCRSSSAGWPSESAASRAFRQPFIKRQYNLTARAARRECPCFSRRLLSSAPLPPPRLRHRRRTWLLLFPLLDDALQHALQHRTLDGSSAPVRGPPAAMFDGRTLVCVAASAPGRSPVSEPTPGSSTAMPPAAAIATWLSALTARFPSAAAAVLLGPSLCRRAPARPAARCRPPPRSPPCCRR